MGYVVSKYVKNARFLYVFRWLSFMWVLRGRWEDLKHPRTDFYDQSLLNLRKLNRYKSMSKGIWAT